MNKMLNFFLLLTLLSLFFFPCSADAEETPEKKRIRILTDIENEPDDAQSLLRFLLYANQFDSFFYTKPVFLILQYD